MPNPTSPNPHFPRPPLPILLRILPLLLIAGGLAGPGGLVAQNGQTTYPGSPDTNANLGVAVDRFTARISGSYLPAATLLTLRNLSRPLVNNMFLSVGNEMVMVVSIPRADQVTVTRAVCGTIAAPHYDGETIAAVWNSCMHNGLRSAIQALETKVDAGGGGGGVTSFNTRTGAVMPALNDYTPAQVGALPATFLDTDPTLAANSNVKVPSQAAVVSYVATHGGTGTGTPSSTPYLYSKDFNFPVGTALGGGTWAAGTPYTFTLSPVPKGVNGTDTNHYIRLLIDPNSIACLITGGTAVSEASSGTITLTCPVTQAGPAGLSSATAGVQEALQYGGVGAWVIMPPGTLTINGPIFIQSTRQTLQGAGRSSTTLLAFSGINYDNLIKVNSSTATLMDFALDGNYIGQTSGSGNLVQLSSGTNGHAIRRMTFIHCGIGGPAAASSAAALLISGAREVEISYNLFMSNWGFDISFATVDATGRTYRGYTIHHNRFGTEDLTSVPTATNYWDTYSAGQYSIIANGYSEMQITNNSIFGGVKKPNLGNSILIANCRNCIISNNLVEGLGVGTGTISVTNGSGAITGSNTFFVTTASVVGDLGTFLEVEGDPNRYQITAVSSATAVTVTPVMSHATGSGLRYRITSPGDGIGCNGCLNAILSNNIVRHTHDNGMDIGSDDFFGSLNQGNHYTVTGNILTDNLVAGLYVGGVSYATVTGNTMMNNGQAGVNINNIYKGGIMVRNDSANYAVVNSNISDNILSDDQTTHTQTFGISIWGAFGLGNVLGQNQYSGNSVAPIFTGATTVLPTAFIASNWSNLPGSALPVASLPACSSALEGKELPVTDANSATFNAAVAGGGSTRIKAYCNSTGWVIH